MAVLRVSKFENARGLFVWWQQMIIEAIVGSVAASSLPSPWRPLKSRWGFYQGCGSGLIQYGSGSGILARSGSTKSLNPYQLRIRFHNRTFEDKSLFQNTIGTKLYYFVLLSYKNAQSPFPSFSYPWIRIRIHKIIESGSNPDTDPQPWFFFLYLKLFWIRKRF
jgi:hypothetical protein